MGTINMMGSLRYSMSGKRRKTNAFSKRKSDPLKGWQPKPATCHYRGDDHREKYPSLEMSPVDNGSCRKKETLKYTGTLIKGIATMHKSNAVPVIDDQHAIDIARMRR
jgi:hypothetical protein